jgi:hypothetical protein
LSKHELKIDWASHEAAKFACVNWHYSKCLPVGKLVKVGVWEDNKYIGVVLFGRGANKSLGEPFGLQQDECCELTRIALTKHKSPVSKIMMIAVKYLKNSNKKLRLAVSFADTEQGHHGGIYQATNWVYNGKTNSADEYIYEGKRWHGRAFRKSKGSHLKYMDKGLIIVKGAKKHRYLMPLDKEMKNQIEPLAKPYPKRGLIEEQQIPSVDGGASPTSTLQTLERQAKANN